MLEDTLAPDGTYTEFDDELSYLKAYSKISSIRHFERRAYPYVRFYGNLATKYNNPRISAFIYHIVGVCKGQRLIGKMTTYDPAGTFGNVVGIGEKQLRRYVHMLSDDGLIGYSRGKNVLDIWVKDERLWDLCKHERIFFYNRALDEKFGINQAILFNVIYRYAYSLDGYRTSPAKVIKAFPWMTYKAADSALYMLRRNGFIDYDMEGCTFGSRRWYPTGKLEIADGGDIVDVDISELRKKALSPTFKKTGTWDEVERVWEARQRGGVGGVSQIIRH